VLDRLSDELEAECAELDALVSGLAPQQWAAVTPFLGWTVRDEIVHLNQVDRFGLVAMSDAEAFAAQVREARAGQAQGIELIEQARRAASALSDAEVLARWRADYQEIIARFRAAQPKQRMPWFGPEMGLASFASARQMEVWAHGQDIYDLLGRTRPAWPRIRNICELGVRTHGWSFRNRGLEVPPAPRVDLAGPDGESWTWNSDGEGLVAGSATGFALIVTQRRHPDDTDVTASTPKARQWLEIAQCFAGEAATGPKPGERAGLRG
jgi:uncharacterized protein (TIGR03084 family)